MSFVAAMSAASKRKQGINGANCYTAEGMGDPRVALYTSLVRGLAPVELMKSVVAVQDFIASDSSSSSSSAADLWTMAFQARDVRGGKGERDLFAAMFKAIMKVRGAAGVAEGRALLPLIPEYGTWLDVIKLFEDPNCLVRSDALALIVKQFRADRAARKADGRISLLAKWLPRAGSKTCGRHTPSLIAEALYPTEVNSMARQRLYRKQCSELNAALKTVEVAMCGNVWATIEPAHVPGRALKLYRNAFLNKKKNGDDRTTKKDRIACATNFTAHLEKVLAGKGAVKGGDTVFPHEITRQIQTAHGAEEDLLTAQWRAIREKVAGAGALGKCVPMCDFSGSMSGVPMDVCMALGILLSEVNHPAFRGGLLTFDSAPQWIAFREGAGLKEKVRQAAGAPWGMNTNFEAALQLVLDRMIEHKVPVGEEPENLVVLTDMGFDAATTVAAGAGWETILESFQQRFKAAGGWSLPRIVVWNLRAAYKDYHATADQPGVLMLSGWSPSAMKILTTGIQVMTPYQGMRAILDDARYDAVRAAVAAAIISV